LPVNVRRTVLVADPDDGSRERIARIARDADYWVLKARTPTETACALDAGPISGVIADEGLLRLCHLGRLLLRAPVLVLSEDRRATMAQDVALIPKGATDAELKHALVALAGNPHYPGPRDIVPFPSSWVDGLKDGSGTARRRHL
jgi:hypothetical protein